MLRKFVFLLIALLFAIPLVIGCGGSGDETLTFSELISRAEDYNGKTVTFEAFYFSGFEISALAGSLGPAVSGPERINPQWPLIWAKGLTQEAFDKLHVQTDTPSGYPEQFGRVLVTGTFETGETYGHMNAYHHMMTITSVEVLDWTPPVPES